MDSEKRFPTIYRIMAENILMRKISSNDITKKEVNNFENKQENNKPKNREQCKCMQTFPHGNYVLRRKINYYLPSKQLFNSSNYAEILKIYTDLRENKNAGASSLPFDCGCQTVAKFDLRDDFFQNETKFNYWKKHYNDNQCSTSFNCIADEEDILNEEQNEKLNRKVPTTKNPITNKFLSVLRNYFCAPLIESDNPCTPEARSDIPKTNTVFDTNYCATQILESKFNGTKYNFDMNDDVHESMSTIDHVVKIPDEIPISKHEMDHETNEFLSILEDDGDQLKIPDSTFYGPNFKHELDDESYEYLSIIEDDTEDFKEWPRDVFLKGTSQKDFEFDYEGSSPQQKLLRSPLSRHFSTCNPYSNKFEFCNESDKPLVEDEFLLVDPIVRYEEFDRQKGMLSEEKKIFSFVSYFKAMMRSEKGKDVCKFIKS